MCSAPLRSSIETVNRSLLHRVRIVDASMMWHGGSQECKHPQCELPGRVIRKIIGAFQGSSEPAEARARAKVEHPFRSWRRIFGFDKMRYRPIAKSHTRLCVCFALATSIWISKGWFRSRLECPGGRNRPLYHFKSCSRSAYLMPSPKGDPPYRVLLAAFGKSRTRAEVSQASSSSIFLAFGSIFRMRKLRT